MFIVNNTSRYRTVIKKFKSKLLITCFTFSCVAFSTVAAATAHVGANKPPKDDASKLLKTARSYAKNGELEKACEVYKSLLASDSTNFTYNFELGLTYLKSPNRFSALPCLQRAERNLSNDTVFDLYYYLGIAYHYEANYNSALEKLRKYKNHATSVNELKKIKKDLDDQITQCENGIQLSLNPNKKLNIKNIDRGVNTNSAEYAPVLTDNDSILLFSARRNLVTIPNEEGGEDFKDKAADIMYVSKIVNGKFLPGQKYIPGELMVNELIKSSQNTVLVSLGWNQEQFVSYQMNKLWHSEYKNGKWSTPKAYDEAVNRSNYQPHGSLTTDGNTLYFSSENNSEDGELKAGLDLFKSVKQSNGKWGPAINLGADINTAKDEDSPNISADGKTLYFASKGHTSIGGYDIFYIQQDSMGNWSKPKNMGIPINSPGDDVHYISDKKGMQAYFASFRKEGYGDMDIYRVTSSREKPNFNICEQLAITNFKVSFNGQTTAQLQDVPVNYSWDMGDGTSLEGNNINHFYKKPGNYTVHLKVTDAADPLKVLENKTIEQPINNVNYLTITSADTVKINTAQPFDALYCMLKDQKITNYYWKFDNRTVYDSISTTHIFKTPGLHEVKLQVIGLDNIQNEEGFYCVSKFVVVVPEDLKEVATPVLANATTASPDEIKFETIYYDFNKSAIRDDARAGLDKNISLLKSNPEAKIVISSHADARGSDRYNFKLTRSRAIATINYLIGNGVPKDRIAVAFAVGETMLVNHCKDGVTCTDTAQQQNRRTEIYLATATNEHRFPEEYSVEDSRLAFEAPVSTKEKALAGTRNKVEVVIDKEKATDFNPQQFICLGQLGNNNIQNIFYQHGVNSINDGAFMQAIIRKRSLIIRKGKVESSQA